MKRKIIFLTGTRADFGKIRSLVDQLFGDRRFEVHIFVTGMHMLRKYGYTCNEIEKKGYSNIYKYINQNLADTMDSVLGKTISGFSDYVKEIQPDMIVVHGDRVETLAGAIVGSLNNILVSHIEGGEVSGTIDDLLRHSISKLSHLHFVTNERARQRLVQLGESRSSIHVIGSPDVDILFSERLPSLGEVKSWYEIPFERYGVMIFHPVTTEIEQVQNQVQCLIDSAIQAGDNYIVIYPNNDNGSDRIIEAYDRLRKEPRFRVIPSMRFEYFLTALKNASYIVGNSSSALMEAPYFGVPAVNVGSRQNNRASLESVANVPFDQERILKAMEDARSRHYVPERYFGEGKSASLFYNIVSDPTLWQTNKQKQFVDI